MMSGVIVKAGVKIQSREIFYNVVVQVVLIYGSEIWAITDAMMKVLEGFHHHIAIRITWKDERKFRAEGWE